MTGTLTGTYDKLDAKPNTGYVELLPSVPVIRDGAGNVLLSGLLRVRLVAGVFSCEVPATSGDSDLDPQGVTYTATAHLATGTLDPVVGIAVAEGDTVSVTEVTPIDPDAPTYAQQVSRGDFDALVDEVEGLGGGAVSSVNTKTGAVVLAASDVGADVAGAAAAAQTAAVAAAATDATTKVATEATARAAAITALTAGSPSQLDTFLEVYNRFLADESTTGGLTTLVGALRSVTDATFRAALIAFLTDSYVAQYDTGWRDVSGLFGGSAGDLAIVVRRVNDVVTYAINPNYSCNFGDDYPFIGGPPLAGFTPGTAIVASPLVIDDGTSAGVAYVNSGYLGGYNLAGTNVPTGPAAGSLVFVTDDAKPDLATLPGTAV